MRRRYSVKLALWEIFVSLLSILDGLICVVTIGYFYTGMGSRLAVKAIKGKACLNEKE